MSALRAQVKCTALPGLWWVTSKNQRQGDKQGGLREPQESPYHKLEFSTQQAYTLRAQILA